MAQSQTNLYNLALSAIGSTDRVASPTEGSFEAETCNLWYEPIRNQVLRAAHWPAARAFQRSALSVTRDTAAAWVATDPKPGWLYTYKQPGDILYPRYLSTFQRFETGINTLKEKVYYTNQENAILIYTKLQDDVSLWDSDLYIAISFGLGAAIALPLHGKLVRARTLEQKANQLILEAQAQSGNEDTNPLEVLPEWLSARGFADSPVSERYVVPFGTLLNSVGGVSVE